MHPVSITQYVRPRDRYADGRESARILQALADQILTAADIARRARKDLDATKALVCALRRQRKLQVDHYEWKVIPHRDGHARRRLIAFYVNRAYIQVQSVNHSVHSTDHGASA